MNFDINLADVPLQGSIFISLLSAWVLVGLFQYLNRYTRRPYFSIWTAGWLFYTLFLTVSFTVEIAHSPALLMAKNWCIATAAVLMLWGSFKFLDLPADHRLIGWTLAFVTAWSYAAAYQFPGESWMLIPAFALLSCANAFTAYSFLFLRGKRAFLGAVLLTYGFALWSLYLLLYPFMQGAEHLLKLGFLVSGVLQLFIAVSMIILMLEEVRDSLHQAREEAQKERSHADYFRAQARTTGESFRQLFESASDPIVLVSSASLEIVRMNQAAASLLRLPPGQSPGPVTEYCSLPVGESAGRPNEQWLEALVTSAECDVTRYDGAKVRVEIRGGAVLQGEERVYQLFLVELTQKAKLQQQLRQAEKLSALGRMISGVAHELNNPLAAIKGYTDLVLLTGDIDQTTRGALIKVAQESSRAVALVKGILTFARPEPRQMQRVVVNDMIREALASRMAGFEVNGVRVGFRLADENPAVVGAADQLQQLVLNLVCNAEQAVQSCAEKQIKVSSRMLNDKVQIRVEDSGPGIADDVLPRIFEPFFTTKAQAMLLEEGAPACAPFQHALHPHAQPLRIGNLPAGMMTRAGGQSLHEGAKERVVHGGGRTKFLH